MPTEIIQRHAARGLVFATDTQRLLLIQTYIPDSGKLIWLTPGGGVEAGETSTDCLYREIYEETGYTATHCEGPVWYRQQQFALREQQFDQYEEFFWVPVESFEPSQAQNPALEEQDIFRQFRWWSLEDIQYAGKHRTGDLFVPLKLGDHLANLLANPLPTTPQKVGW